MCVCVCVTAQKLDWACSVYEGLVALWLQVCGVELEGVVRELCLHGQAVMGLSHPLGTDFTLTFQSGVKARCSLPYQHHGISE